MGLDLFTHQLRTHQKRNINELFSQVNLDNDQLQSVDNIEKQIKNDQLLHDKCGLVGRHVGRLKIVDMKMFCRGLAHSILRPTSSPETIKELKIESPEDMIIYCSAIHYGKNKYRTPEDLAHLIKKSLEDDALYEHCLPHESVDILSNFMIYGPVRIWTNADSKNTPEQLIKIAHSKIAQIRNLIAKLKVAADLEKYTSTKKHADKKHLIKKYCLNKYDKYEERMKIKHHQEFASLFNQHQHHLEDNLDISMLNKIHILNNFPRFFKSLMQEEYKKMKKNIFGISASQNKRDLLPKIAEEFNQLGINRIIVLDDRQKNLDVASQKLSEYNFDVITRQIAGHIKQTDLDKLRSRITEHTGFVVDWDGVISKDDVRYYLQNMAIINALRKEKIII